MAILTFTQTQLGAKAELFEGMVTVEIHQDFIPKPKDEFYGWYHIMIGSRFYSRDKYYQGDKRFYYPYTRDGLEGAKEMAERIVEKVVRELYGRLA